MKFYTVKELAGLVRRTPRTIYRWIAEGFIRPKKVRDGWLIPEEEIERILHLKADLSEIVRHPKSSLRRLKGIGH